MQVKLAHYWPQLRSVLSQYKWRILSYSYAGTRFYCPICRGHFRKMRLQHERFSILGKVVWDGVRDNNVCPRCNSLMRHRFMMAFLRARTNLFKARLTVLHFAPEEALRRVLKRARNLTYIAADLTPWRADMRSIDVTAMPLEDNSVDVVLCSHVLEHVDDQAAMAELYRVLKPGGWALVAVPIFVASTYEDATVQTEEARLRMFGSATHVRLYGLDIVERLQQAGFDVATYALDDIPGNYVDRAMQNIVMDAERHLFLCHKKSVQNPAPLLSSQKWASS